MNDSDLELYGIIGKMLRETREIKELPLEAGASFLNIAPKSLQRYECGERKIKIGTVKQLCAFYHINFDAFLIEAKRRFEKNGSNRSLYTCPECGFSYFNDSDSDRKEHSSVHKAWHAASEKFGKLYCYVPENNNIKMKNRSIRNDLSHSLDQRFAAEIQILKCQFSESVSSNAFDLNHIPFHQYVAMMLQNESYSCRLDQALYQKLTLHYGSITIPVNGTYICHLSEPPSHRTGYPEKLLNFYHKLNETGQYEAEKRVEELTFVPFYIEN